MQNKSPGRKTLKQVQGDKVEVLAMHVTMPIACHAELVSASVVFRLSC